MVLNLADLGKCLESSQTPWNAPYVLTNGFSTTLGIVGETFGWISTGPKSADFDQKPWTLAHGFEHGGLECRESLQTPWNVSYVLAIGLSTFFGIIGEDFERIPRGPKSADFDQKAWTIAHGFE